MNTSSLFRRLGTVAVFGLLLSACAETQFVMHTAKKLGDTTASQGDYKVGKPYQIAGSWYYPSENWEYDETGIASWYGPKFHGKSTANGEVFDQWGVSAAHKTLPMPSLVRVTNLDNGRSLVVRINDRGPFVGNRIIDMSKRAAQLLGFEGQGTAKVRVQIMAKESLALAQRAKAGGNTQLASADSPIQSDSVASSPIASEDLPELNQPVAVNPVVAPPPPAPVVEAHVGELTRVPVTPTRIYVQAGAFSDQSNAERVKNTLSSIGTVSVSPVPVNGRSLFRVRVGPIDNVADADRMLEQVVQAGYGEARTVVD
ncbi:MAG TPA: septal ring lytic transglycosylase RlpA family protein [Magnetovibrio sp.]